MSCSKLMTACPRSEGRILGNAYTSICFLAKLDALSNLNIYIYIYIFYYLNMLFCGHKNEISFSLLLTYIPFCTSDNEQHCFKI